MRAIIVSLLLFGSTLFSGDTSLYQAQKEILQSIFYNIHLGRDLKVWSDDEGLNEAFRDGFAFELASSCNEASLLVINTQAPLTNGCQNKPTFVLKYQLLRDLPHSFGSLYWKKARPNIVIIEPRAKEQNIIISTRLREYVEQKLW
ncbi:MAG: hypothetical protein WCR69_07055 [Sulfuricurvum sp.]